MRVESTCARPSPTTQEHRDHEPSRPALAETNHTTPLTTRLHKPLPTKPNGSPPMQATLAVTVHTLTPALHQVRGVPDCKVHAEKLRERRPLHKTWHTCRAILRAAHLLPSAIVQPAPHLQRRCLVCLAGTNLRPEKTGTITPTVAKLVSGLTESELQSYALPNQDHTGLKHSSRCKAHSARKLHFTSSKLVKELPPGMWLSLERASTGNVALS
mmetsp:Transcript_71903/g.191807  ORF Transcript_71903/g.191807 Transcript_71903/m.191807 type:complete len:214 (+) Transcript_71903:238-879(+)